MQSLHSPFGSAHFSMTSNRNLEFLRRTLEMGGEFVVFGSLFVALWITFVVCLHLDLVPSPNTINYTYLSVIWTLRTCCLGLCLHSAIGFASHVYRRKLKQLLAIRKQSRCISSKLASPQTLSPVVDSNLMGLTTSSRNPSFTVIMEDREDLEDRLDEVEAQIRNLVDAHVTEEDEDDHEAPPEPNVGKRCSSHHVKFVFG